VKILFYLPAVTPWWLDNIVGPMLRVLSGDRARVELHVVAAKLWRNTGVTLESYLGLADLSDIRWHIVEHEAEAFRFAGAQVPGLAETIAAIDPDLTLARSADLALAQWMPGTVRYIMEGAAPPFDTDPRWIVLDEVPFRHGHIPDAATDLADACAAQLAPAWAAAERRLGAPTRESLGLPADRPIVAVPLNYEHDENLFLTHAAAPRGVDLVARLLAALPDEIVLAVSDHPLNRLHVDRSEIDALVGRHAHRARLFPTPGDTNMLAQISDAMVIDLSKSWAIAAFFGTPMLDLGTRAHADWLHAVPGVAALADTLAGGERAAPAQADARRWFGWHLGGRIADAAALPLERLLRCVADRPTEGDAMDNCAMLLARQAQPA
jgi:hypothetical protein